MKIKTGIKAPWIPSPDQDGKEVTLDMYKGKKLVLMFYPQANTPTCTTVACNFTDHFKALKKEGIDVLGISPDSIRKQNNFKKKYKMPFRLISDPDRKLIELYGLWGMKFSFGREYMGVIRKNFILDEEGKIIAIIDQVESKNAAKQVLDTLSSN